MHSILAIQIHYLVNYLCRRNDNAENTPILVVDVKNIKRRDEEILSQIRTNPPTPQYFSVSRGITKATPSKPLKSRPLVCVINLIVPRLNFAAQDSQTAAYDLLTLYIVILV